MRALLFAAAAILIAARQLSAATLFDPALRFHVIETEHFAIYFHQGEEPMARRLAAIAEDTWRALERPFGVRPPRRTHVVLADQTELANGYATPVPYDTIVIYAVWPSGSEFIGDADDWLRVAFTHEFTHVVHLDRSEGWARAVRGLFGRTALAFPNLFLPTWQIEGLATYEESVITGEGRLHAGDFGAIVSEAARHHALEPLDRVNGGLTDWPGGTTPYAYGAGFHRYLADRFGVERLGVLASDTARRLPYTGSMAFRHVFGESLGDLWRDYEDSLPVTAAAPDGTRITNRGFVVVGPRFDRTSPNDVVYSVRNADEFPAIYSVDVATRRTRRLATRYLGSTVAVGSRAIYFDQQEVRRNVGVYSDLYALERDTGHVRALTRDARLIDPDLSPDETTIVAVRDRPGGRDPVLINVARGFQPSVRVSEQPSVLVSELETQFNAPRWSPDGRLIAVERHQRGRLSEIAVIDVATKTIRTVAAVEGARVVTPAWRPDGAAIVAAVAPDEEPFNLVEFPLEAASRPRQLTHTTGGATWPDISPDGRTIVYVGYTPAGFDLFTMPYPTSPAQFTDMRAERSDSQIAQTTEPSAALTSQEYSPIATLAPTSWSPILTSDGTQLRAGAGVAGIDVLGYHGYAASATWLVSGPSDAAATPTATPDWQLSYVYDRWRPTLFAAASTATSFFAGPPSDAGTPADATLRERQLEAGVFLPIRHTRASHSLLLSGLRAVDDYTFPHRLQTLDRTAVRGAWTSTTAHTYGYSVSPEDGIAAGATVELVRRSLGSSGDATTATADVRGYLPGVAPHHVIALRAAAGSSSGDATVARAFLLGGSATDSGVASFGSSAAGLLRGFPANTFAGTHVASTSADYRFPIARPQRGAGTWPILVHTISAAIFADAGHAWTRTFRAADVKTSAGAELSIAIVAGYGFPLTLTAGAARGHDPSGVVGDRTTAYFRVGKAF